MVTTIGIDPHKATHTATAINDTEQILGEVTVAADQTQVKRLVLWADQLGTNGRVWAVESAGGLGSLLSQQLLAVGESVVDVPAVLAARVRVLGSGRSQKNDENDARSIAIAALRQKGLHPVTAETHVGVLRMLAKRHLELTSLRTQAVCRLHAVLAALQPGGMPRRLSATKATAGLRAMRPVTPIGEQRKAMGRQHLVDIRRLDRDLGRNRGEIKDAVAVSGTTLMEIRGVGPVVAAFLIGYTGDSTRFPTADRYASYNGTAPIEASSGPRVRHRLNLRGNRTLNHAIHMAAVSQLRYPCEGRVYYDKKIAEGKTKKEAMRALKRRISNVVYRRLVADEQHTTS